MHEDLINRYNFCNRLFSIGEKDVDTKKKWPAFTNQMDEFQKYKDFFF